MRIQQWLPPSWSPASFALGSPQAAACWETGYRSGYGYSSPAYRGYYGGVGLRRVGYGAVGWRRGYGYRGVGIGRVGVGRVGRRR
jgi:hypothetical protein